MRTEDKRSTLMRNLCDEDKAAVKTSTSALFTFLLDSKRDNDLVRLLQEYALKRSESIKYKSLLTEMRSLKTRVLDSLVSADDVDEKKRELDERINDILRTNA